MLKEWSLFFYGTTYPIFPNDPVSTARTTLVDITTPNSSSTRHIYSAQYPRMSNNNVNFSKLGSTGKLSTPKSPFNKSVYVAAYSDIRNDPLFKAINQGFVNKKQQSSKNSKANKNTKGKSQENNKSSKNLNNGGRPVKPKESTTQVTLNSHKNKFNRILQLNKTQTISESSPKQQKVNKLQKSSERLHINEDKINRKLFGDVVQPSSTSISSINRKINLKSTVLSSKGVAKATKQIKEHMATKTPLAATDILIPIRGGPFALQPNQRITKLFERYEKIQSIFPEFQPYQPILKDKNEKAAALKTTQKNLHSDIGTNSSHATSGGIIMGKPLRESSKKSSPGFVADKQLLKKQQLLLTAAGFEGTQSPTVTIPASYKKNSNGRGKL